MQIHPSSFNHRTPKFDTAYLVYHEKVKATGKICVHDCTSVTTLDLMLFGSEPQIFHAQHRALIDGWLEVRVSPRTAVLFKALRRQLTELMRRKIEGTMDGSADMHGDAAVTAEEAKRIARQ